VRGNGLGANYHGTLWSGQATPLNVTGAGTGTFAGGVLMMFRLTSDRSHLDLSADPRLADRVVDNGIAFPPPVGTAAGTPGYKYDGTESESLMVGQNFGVITDIQTGPDGNLYIASNTDNAVYRISRIQ
jgi:aldose sugar dehydrogenase